MIDNNTCGKDCGECPYEEECRGCVATNGRPFGGKKCAMVTCCEENEFLDCSVCGYEPCRMKDQLLRELRGLGFPELTRLDWLYHLRGAAVNLAYPMPDGSRVRLLSDDDIYFGGQVMPENSDRIWGAVGNDDVLLVASYRENFTDPELICYRKKKH